MEAMKREEMYKTELSATRAFPRAAACDARWRMLCGLSDLGWRGADREGASSDVEGEMGRGIK